MNKNLKKKLRKATRQWRKYRKAHKGIPISFEGNATEVRKMGIGDYTIKFDTSVADKLRITFKG